jgi:thiol:disulfide interchange protein DsbA
MRIARAVTTVLLAATAVWLAAGAAAQLEPGKQYKSINPPQTPADTSKVEVIEFFSYACSHCYDFEPAVQSWLKRKPKDVEYRLVPMVFRDNWRPLARLYYTLEAMGELDRLHEKVYTSVHREGQQLFTDQAVVEWAKRQGLDGAKFQQVYSSFGIDSKLQRSMAMSRAYGVQFTPSIAVNGKYYTGPSMVAGSGGAADYERFFEVVDELIARERPPAQGGTKRRS